MEEWKDIKGYEGSYQISNTGKVKSLSRKIKNNSKKGYYISNERILSPHKHKIGYLRVPLQKDGKGKTFSIHRLVAEAFIDNTENHLEVNHIDHNKENNNYKNLEWCTRQHNIDATHDFYGTKKKDYFCEICNTKVYYLNKICQSCEAKSRRKVERPSKELLSEEIKANTFTALGKKYGVSDSTIKKWCKSYGLPHRKKDLK